MIDETAPEQSYATWAANILTCNYRQAAGAVIFLLQLTIDLPYWHDYHVEEIANLLKTFSAEDLTIHHLSETIRGISSKHGIQLD